MQNLTDIAKIMIQPTASNPWCKLVNNSHGKCLANIYFIGASICGTTTMIEYLSLHPDIFFVKRSVPPDIRKWDLCRLHDNELANDPPLSIFQYVFKRISNGVNSLLCTLMLAVSSYIYPAQKHGNSSKSHREIHRLDRHSYEYTNTYVELLDEWVHSPVIPVEALSNPRVIHYTPHYLYAPSVPFDLKKLYSTIKPGEGNSGALTFIIMLRNPISRALSSYWFKNSYLFDIENRDSGNTYIRD